MAFEQISLFIDEPTQDCRTKNCNNANIEPPPISERLFESFDASEIPFFGCDFDTLYPQLAEVVPVEKIIFNCWDINVSIACEVICAAICHQMNWDYLRHAVFEKTHRNVSWVNPERLSFISETDVYSMFANYNKPERIRASERTLFLRQIGELARKHGNFSNLFMDNEGNLWPETRIRSNLLDCKVFSHDPSEKKLQLLFQKLSSYRALSHLEYYCKPAIDYHLIRCYLRRGLIFPKNKLATEFMLSTEISRKESTMAALRQLCSTLMQRISTYTDLSINSINQIEWHIGRSICIEKNPDCLLCNSDAKWIKQKYEKCPFYNSCCAINFNPNLLNIDEPTYTGPSY